MGLSAPVREDNFMLPTFFIVAVFDLFSDAQVVF